MTSWAKTKNKTNYGSRTKIIITVILNKVLAVKLKVFFVVLITNIIFLTLVNRYIYYSIFITLLDKNNLVPIIIGITNS